MTEMNRNSRTLAIRSDPAVHAAVQLSCFLLLLSAGIVLCLHHIHLMLSRLSQGSGSHALNILSVDPAWDWAVGSGLVLALWRLTVVGVQLNRLWYARDE